MQEPMNRRDFLYRALGYSAAGLLVPPFLRRGPFSPLAAFAAAGGPPFAGQTLVVVNYTGGNDGLNTVVPVDDPLYYAARPTIAIQPGDAVLIETGVGLHPQLAPLQSHYAAGRMAVIQGIGYENMNLSHFRGTDIWFSASSPEQYIETGWMARFFERMFPEFPEITPESPYALQQGLSHRIPLTGNRGTTGVVVDNPDTFYELVGVNYTGEWDDELPDTRGGEELEFIRTIDRETFAYAQAIQAAAENGQNTVPYPQTSLGLQLEIVAKLISGGLATPLYLTSEFGFDTHAQQAGAHANLMASVGQSINTFMADLGNQDLRDRVLVMTTSEFGRRVNENGGYGTDHGTAAPHFLIGETVNGGVYGGNPDLSSLDPNGNMLIQHDYRTVYGTILRDWFGASPAAAQDVLFGDYGTIPVLDPVASTGDGRRLPAATRLLPPSPNPMRARAASSRVRFELASPGRVRLDVYDAGGRRVAELVNGSVPAGRHEATWRIAGASAGAYFVRLQTPQGQEEAKVVILP